MVRRDTVLFVGGEIPSRCVVGSVDRICFIRWSKHPTADEVRAVVEAVLAERRAVGRPLVLFAVVRADCDVPEPSAALEMVRSAPFIDHAIETGINVIEGTATPTRLLRGSLHAIAAALRSPWEIMADCESGLALACRKLGLDIATVRAEAVARGLFPG